MSDEEKNIIETALQAGKSLAKFELVKEDYLPETRVVIPEGMKVEILKSQTAPFAKTGNLNFVAAKSFCEYVNKHKVGGQTIIIADESEGKIKAIIDDHGPDKPSFCVFTAMLDLGFSKQFAVWLNKSFNEQEHKFSQSNFADFIEDNRTDLMIGDIVKEGEKTKNLSGLELSDLVNNLQISSEVNLTSKRNPHDDQMEYSYEVKDGAKSSFKLPKSIFLAIPVYKHGDIFQIELRLRSTAGGGQPRFWYIIDQLESLKEKAFDMICGRIKTGNKGSEASEDKQFEGTKLEVWKGTF